ncbi:MAG TPA: ankyrin repeat domain-containing protein [Pyrinomonadaceae bacterium]|nr:ankyrin repeat domain-containing protein [Pyrinomonadaceae bacterium]
MSNANATGKETQASVSALLEAAGGGDAARVASFVAGGASADARLPNGETPLMRAGARGYEDVARALLDEGADVNACRADGFTPLLLAAFFGHESLVRLLLERGADADARTRLGTTARQWADARGFARIAALLPAAAARTEESAARSESERVNVEEPARTPAEEFEKSRAEEFEKLRAEDVSIFSRKRERKGVRAAFERADPEGAEKLFSTPPASALTSSASDSTSSSSDPASASRAASSSGISASSASASTSSANGSAQSKRVSASEDSDSPAVIVSVRRDEALPSHPSASGFRLGNFLRSWQASVGTALLLLAFGVGGFALWRDSKTAAQNQRPAPTPQGATPQTAAQPVAPLQTLPAPQASPSPEAQAGAVPAETPGASYVVPVPAQQTYYNPPNSVLTNAPKEPTVISESGAPAADDSTRPKNRADTSARATPSPAQTGQGRDDSSGDNARASESGRSARANDPQPARPSTPPPAPEPTPRGKVIQWPPQ